MSELIDRQAALEALRTCYDTDRIDMNNGDEYIINDAVGEIDGLPSAQPNLQPTCNQLATDCISRAEAIDAIDKCAVWVMYTQGDSQKDEAEFAENIIKQTKMAIKSMLREDLPSAQPELSDEEKRLIKQLRSYHNGSYAKVIDKLIAFAQQKPLKYSGDSICVYCMTSDCDGCMYEPMEGTANTRGQASV